MQGFALNIYKWLGFAILGYVIFTLVSTHQINNQSKVNVNKQRHLLEDLSESIVAYTQKHAGISDVGLTPNGKIYGIDDYIKSVVKPETHTTDFDLRIELTEKDTEKTYTATASYKDKKFTGLGGDAMKVRLQKGDLITVYIKPYYKQMIGAKFVDIEGRELISTGRAHGYIKFKEG